MERAVFALLCAGTWLGGACCGRPSARPPEHPRSQPRQLARTARGEAPAARGQFPDPPPWFKATVTEARRRLTGNPNDPRARRDMALALYAAGRFTEAVPHFVAVVRTWPKSPHAHYYLGHTYMALERPKDARREFLSVLKLDREASRDPEVLCDIGQACKEAGRLAEAQGHFEQALRLDPLSYRAEHGLGSIAAARGRITVARRHFQRMLARCARSPRERAEGHAALGKLALESGDVDEARTEFAKALQLNPANSWALAGLRRLRELDPR